MAASCLSQEPVLHSLGLEAGGLTQTLLPGHVTQKVPEPVAAWSMHRGLQQGLGSGAQTHHALPVSTFLPKCKGFLINGQHLSTGLTSRRAEGLLTPAMACQVAKGEKKKTKTRLQDSLAPANSTSPTDAAPLSFLAVLRSLLLSAAQRRGFEARCPEGASLRTAKGPQCDPVLQDHSGSCPCCLGVGNVVGSLLLLT